MSMITHTLSVILIGCGALVAVGTIFAALLMPTPSTRKRLIAQLTITIVCANIGALIVASAAMGGPEILLALYRQYSGPFTVFAAGLVVARSVCSLLYRKLSTLTTKGEVNHLTLAP